MRCRTGDQPPEKAVIGGNDEGPSYHARAKIYNGKTIPGKVGVTRQKDGDLKEHVFLMVARNIALTILKFWS